MSPFPRRYGGGKPALKTIVDSLGAQLGTAYDTTSTTTNTSGEPPLVYIRMQAVGRALWAAWEQNQRMAYQWDAQRMTDFLPRWEKIFGLYPLSTDSLATRRARVGIAMARVGAAAGGDVYAVCLAYLGPLLVSIVTSSSGASGTVVWTPKGWPVGTNQAKPTDPDWYSTVSYIAIKVQQPSTMLSDEFYATCASVMVALDAILPAWVTFTWIRQDIHPGAGFYLDELNLDNEAFDT